MGQHRRLIKEHTAPSQGFRNNWEIVTGRQEWEDTGKWEGLPNNAKTVNDMHMGMLLFENFLWVMKGHLENPFVPILGLLSFAECANSLSCLVRTEE